MTDDPTQPAETETTNDGPSTDGVTAVQAAVSSEYKVRGRKDAPSGTGVLGDNTATSGESYGVEGATDSVDTGAAGVFGQAQAGSGNVHGVKGVTSSIDASASGVRGEYLDTSSGPGVAGFNLADGVNEDVHSVPMGVFGQCDRGLGYGVVGKNTGTDDYSIGVLGYTTTSTAPPVWGYNNTNYAANAIGLRVDGYQKVSQTTVSAYLGSSQGVPSGANTTVAYDTLAFDDWNGGNFDTSTGEFTAPAAGKYHVAAGIGWAQSLAAGDQIFLEIYVESGRRAKNFRSVAASASPNMHLSKTVRVNSGETIRVDTYQTNGSTRNLAAGQDETFVTIDKIG